MKQFIEELRSALDTENLDYFDKLMAIDCMVEAEERRLGNNELAQEVLVD